MASHDKDTITIEIPIAILPGWEPGEPKTDYFEISESNRKDIDETVPHEETEIIYNHVDDAIGPYVKQHHETDLVAVCHAREAYQTDSSENDIDAILLPCFDEPGIAAAREVSETLVMSTPSATLHVASMLGHNIGIISSGTASGETSVLREIIRKYGFENRVVSVRPTGMKPTEMNAELLSDEERERMESRALAEAEAAIEDDGADVIIAYSGSYEHLSQQLDVPVIDPKEATLKMTEAMVELGLSHSKKAYPTPQKIHERYLRE